MAKRKLTPKQRVLKKLPTARSWRGLPSGVWYVADVYGRELGRGVYSPVKAWADAARKLKEAK